MPKNTFLRELTVAYFYRMLCCNVDADYHYDLAMKSMPNLDEYWLNLCHDLAQIVAISWIIKERQHEE